MILTQNANKNRLTFLSAHCAVMTGNTIAVEGT